MRSIAQTVIRATGWRRHLMACAAGAVGALAMPPLGFLPAIAVSLTTAVWLIDGTRPGRRLRIVATPMGAALAGWSWGFGYFVVGLWWLGAAFLVEADMFAWAMPLGVLGLPAVLALFPALGFALARALWSEGAGRLFALAFGLSISEWLRGHLLTGFPWNAVGLAFGQNAWLMQTAAIVGLYGLTALAILIAATPATLWTAATASSRWYPPAFGALALAALAAYGALRIPGEPVASVEGVRLRIMQPNLPQDAKFRPENRDAIMQRYLSLSERTTSPTLSGMAHVTHLVWPESAFPFLLERDPGALAEIAALLPNGTTLIAGAARAEGAPPGEDGLRFYNAIQVIGHHGTILNTYDKVHLVPFGEYLPAFLDEVLRWIGLRQFVHIPGGFQAGTGRVLLPVPGLPSVAPAICYEAIFPGEVIPPGERVGLIVNLTNDAWFGNTPGPYQHFAQARLRAVEHGIPLVRAANSGISAIVDPYGRATGLLPLGTEAVLDSALPVALEATPFTRYGDALFWAMLAVCFGIATLTRAVPEGRTRSGSEPGMRGLQKSQTRRQDGSEVNGRRPRRAHC